MPQMSEREMERGAVARTLVPRRRPASRRVVGRPAKPARRDNARRVFTRRERPNLHAHAGRARAAGPRSSYWTPLRVRLPTQAAPRTTIAWLFDRILYWRRTGKCVQFACRPATFDQGAFYCLQRHGCYWRLEEIQQQAMGGN